MVANNYEASVCQKGNAIHPTGDGTHAASCKNHFRRVRLWKLELQRLANETGLQMTVSYFPPGISKWNKIEHRLFSFVSQNWRGKPLISHEVIVNLITATTTRQGLQVQCQLDTNLYPKGIKVSDEAMRCININTDDFHGEWNYTISPCDASTWHCYLLTVTKLSQGMVHGQA